MALFVFDAHKNFAISAVATAPSPATSGTSLVVTAADGTKFPAVPFDAMIWPASTQPTTSNAEIVRVTAISTDTFTITRAQESSVARTVIVGDQIAAGITAKTLQDIEQIVPRLVARQGGTTGAASWQTVGTSNTDLNGTSPFMQVGATATSASAGVDTTVTFPYAYNQLPLVWLTVNTANGSNMYVSANSISTTIFKQRMLVGSSAETLAWMSVGI